MKWYIIISFFFLSSCEEDTQPPPAPCVKSEENELKVVWQKELSPEFEQCWSMTPIVHDNQVIFSDYLCGVPEKLMAFTGEGGDLIWEWEKYIIPRLLVKTAGIRLSGDDLVVSAEREFYSIELKSGKTNWEYKFDHSRTSVGIINHQVYLTETNGGEDYDKCELLRTDIKRLEWEKVLEITEKDGYRPGIEPPVLYVHPTKDSILIFQNRQYNFNIGDGKVDLAAYNLAQDTFLWYIDDIDPHGNSSIYTPIIHEDKIYFQGARTIFCIEAETGKVIWQKQPGSSYFICEMMLLGDKLIVKGDNDQIDALDPITGDLLWHNPEAGANVVNMAIYKDRIYYGSKGDGALRCLSLDTGELLWIKASPNRKEFSNASFVSGVAVNEDLGYLYIHDKYFAMCIDLNE